MSSTRYRLALRGESLLLPFHVLIALVLCQCCILSETEVASWVSVFCFLLVYASLCAIRPEFIFKYVYLHYVVIGHLLGVMIVEFGDVYLYELGIASGFTGSCPLLVFTRFIFLMVLYYLDMAFGGNIPQRRKDEIGRSEKWIKVATILFLVLTLYCFINVFPYPSFFNSLDKFAYMSQVLSGWPGRVNVLLIYLLPLLALGLVYGNRKLSAAALVVYAVYLFWCGQRFGMFLAVATVILACFFDKLILVRSKSDLAKGLLFLLLVFIGILSVTALSQIVVGGLTGQELVDFFSDRFAMQGEVWSVAYGLINEGGPISVSDSFLDEISSWFDPSQERKVQNSYGIYKMMALVGQGNPSYYSGLILGGARFTEGALASVYFYFDWAGCLSFAVISAAASFFLYNGLIRSFAQRSIIESVCYWYLLYVSFTSLSMFTFNDFFTPIGIVCIAIVVIKKIMPNSNRFSKNSTWLSGAVDDHRSPSSCRCAAGAKLDSK